MLATQSAQIVDIEGSFQISTMDSELGKSMVLVIDSHKILCRTVPSIS